MLLEDLGSLLSESGTFFGGILLSLSFFFELGSVIYRIA
jgi:hypothetical protein